MLIKRRKHRNTSINAASTADISFMLLIFFIMTTSMDMDKGLSQQLPAKEQKKEVLTEIRKDQLMDLKVSNQNTLYCNDAPLSIYQLKEKATNFITSKRTSHAFSLSADSLADYQTYYTVQQELAKAYYTARDRYAMKKYGMHYRQCSNDLKREVRDSVPQRIFEQETRRIAE